MKRKTVMVVGVACGLACACCVGLYMESVRNQVDQARADSLERYGGEQLEVVVAKRDIAPGETIDDSLVETKLWVADLLPSEAVTSIEDVSGRSATSAILAGEVLSERRFAGESEQLDVPDGLIAISVPAKDVQAVGGAIRPGMKVDVYATGGTSTDLLIQDVLVLATSNVDSRGASGGSVAWVTVAVRPSSVQEIVSAAQKMELYFALPGGEVASSDEGEDEVEGDAASNEKDSGSKAESDEADQSNAVVRSGVLS